MIWFIYCPLMLLMMLICYITNPIVLLFADEVGELKGVLHYWQTWDSTTDAGWYVREELPSFLQYDFDSKYEEATIELEAYNKTKSIVILKEGATFTIKERIQRYLCRLCWLSRNCAYGFGFYVFGRGVKAEDRYVVREETPQIIRAKDVWCIKGNVQICKYIALNIYLGWKMFPHTNKDTHCMVANRIAFRITC